MPLSAGGLEQLVLPVKHSIYPRRFALQNRERLNRLLMLMQLHINGHDSELAYRTAIWDWLIANQRGARSDADATSPIQSDFLRSDDLESTHH